MQVISPIFNNNQQIPPRYTCKGDGINPPLSIARVPANAKSLALVLRDPDSPSGTFTHWLLWNIGPDTDHIPEAGVPKGSQQGTNDFGQPTYGGPCPHQGTHRYVFTLYALDSTLDLPISATASTVMQALQPHVIDQAQLVGLFSADLPS